MSRSPILVLLLRSSYTWYANSIIVIVLIYFLQVCMLTIEQIHFKIKYLYYFSLTILYETSIDEISKF